MRIHAAGWVTEGTDDERPAFVKKKRFNLCNVLEAGSSVRRLWNFKIDRTEAKLEREESLAEAAAFPTKLTGKDWNHLLQPRLNVAWLPADQVFLRAVQLPAEDEKELLSMLEFQLEKISPLPPAQVVWSVEMVAGAPGQPRTAVICIVPRETVESFLGKLEKQDYATDLLEVPQLVRIAADGAREDGAWLYFDEADQHLCVVAWWAQGVLQQVQLVRLPTTFENPNTPPGETPPALSATELRARQAAFLQEQLMQTAWAGEVEGWAEFPVRWHLCANGSLREEWLPLVQAWTVEPVGVSDALDRANLARFSAARAAAEAGGANLLPPEAAARYRQGYVDRLWMGGLATMVGLYCVGVMIYMVALQVFSFRQERVQAEAASLATTYTNVLQLKERVQVLQEQLNLKFAALDCLKTSAELLPEGFTLTRLAFGRNSKLELAGTAPLDQRAKVSDFNESVGKATVNGQRLFESVSIANINNRPGAVNLSWDFHGVLRQAEP